MKTGDSLEITTLVRSQKTGVLLPRQGTFVREIENLGRKLILVDFGSAAFIAEFLDGLSAQTEILFNDRVNGAGSRKHGLEALSQQETQIALLHLARRLAKGESQRI